MIVVVTASDPFQTDTAGGRAGARHMFVSRALTCGMRRVDFDSRQDHVVISADLWMIKGRRYHAGEGVTRPQPPTVI